MIRIILNNISRFIILVLLQIFIFNKIQFSGFINPYIYILFILLLPFETPPWILLLSGFLLGFSVDMFTQTPGIHSAATVFLTFCRPSVLRIISPRGGYESGTYPSLYYFGITWFFKYTLILVLIHHLFLFFIEVFTLSDFFMTLIRALLSSIFSILLIIMSQYFVFKK
jgi:rod shape-determining protein MreD